MPLLHICIGTMGKGNVLPDAKEEIIRDIYKLYL